MKRKLKLWSINALCRELERNARTLARALEDTPADGKIAGRKAWTMASAVAALAQYEKKMMALTGRVVARSAPARLDPQLDKLADEVFRTGVLVDHFLEQLAALPTVEARRALLESGAGRVVGLHEKALEASLGRGPDAFLRSLAVDKIVQLTSNEIERLCGLRVIPESDEVDA